MNVEKNVKNDIQENGDMTIHNSVKNTNIEVDGKALFILAQTILVILKLAGVLNASWWIVLLPILIPVGFIVLLFIVMLIGCFVSPEFRAKIIDKDKDDDEEDG